MLSLHHTSHSYKKIKVFPKSAFTLNFKGTPLFASASGPSMSLPAMPLEEAKQRIQDVVTEMAGEPENFLKRAIHMVGAGLDTGMQNLFPAVWASAALKIGPLFMLPRGFLSNLLPLASLIMQPFREGKQKLHQLSQDLCATNREIFIKVLTQYYFIKTCGQHPEAWRLVQHPNPHELLRVYQKLSAQTHSKEALLTAQERQLLYEADLSLEQKEVVEPRLQRMLQELNWGLVERILKKPFIQLPFFPRGIKIQFDDFFNLEDRLRCGMKAFSLAQQASPKEMIASFQTAMINCVRSEYNHQGMRIRPNPMAQIQTALHHTQQKLRKSLGLADLNPLQIECTRHV